MLSQAIPSARRHFVRQLQRKRAAHERSPNEMFHFAEVRQIDGRQPLHWMNQCTTFAAASREKSSETGWVSAFTRQPNIQE